MTLRYTFGSFAPVYGKAYFNGSDAADAYGWLSHLWRQGFERGSILEVPQPVGFVPRANLVLMRSAEGVSLDKRIAANPVESVLAGTRLAARWLVKCQDTAIPELRCESPCDKIEIFTIIDAIAKVAAEHPEHSALLIDMVHELRSLAPKSNLSPPVVPTHGQFRPAHVFIDDTHVTVIDIEKLFLSDPAKDVARFCYVLKKTCLEGNGDGELSERAAQEFVAEYRAHSKSHLENLPYFRALLALKAFAKLLNNRKVNETQRQRMCQAYRAEFERWVQYGLVQKVAA